MSRFHVRKGCFWDDQAEKEAIAYSQKGGDFPRCNDGHHNIRNIFSIHGECNVSDTKYLGIALVGRGWTIAK